MSNIIQAIRGTYDLFGEEYLKQKEIIRLSEEVLKRFGYKGIETPIFENLSVFAKNLGETTDIVNKEMYTFQDRNGDWLCLRPEGTASVARAILNHHMIQQQNPLKLYYYGPMFRYERPQKGRYRQFYQLGIECLGLFDPLIDAETIIAGYQLLEALNIKDWVLEINTLGDAEDRKKFRDLLTKYFQNHSSKLSKESQDRLEKNPMRILDSKEEQDQEIIQNAPKIFDVLSDESKSFFDKVLDILKTNMDPAKINVNERLVRGLDYYCHTAFEFKVLSLGAQNAVLGGGRYDGLLSQMGGPVIPAVGWGMGVDRLALSYQMQQQENRPIAIIPINQSLQDIAFEIAIQLRDHGITVDLEYSGNMSKRLKKAQKNNAAYALMFGEDELKSQLYSLKELDSGHQQTLKMDDIIRLLKAQTTCSNE